MCLLLLNLAVLDQQHQRDIPLTTIQLHNSSFHHFDNKNELIYDLVHVCFPSNFNYH